MIHSLRKILFVTASTVFMAASAMATPVTSIGTGTTGSGINLDTNDAAGRTNVNDYLPVLLTAGSWQATMFNFDAGVGGTVTPFLAMLTGSNTYKVLALGTRKTVVAGENQSISFGMNSFTLAAATNVYAGIVTYGSRNPIDIRAGGTTDHDSSPSLVTLGGIVNNFSHANLARSYAFSIDVAPQVSSVPEPASLILLGLGLAGLAVSRRKQS